MLSKSVENESASENTNLIENQLIKTSRTIDASEEDSGESDRDLRVDRFNNVITSNMYNDG